MIFTIILLIIPVVGVLIYLKSNKKSNYRLPPIIKGLPLVGYFPYLKPSFSEAILKLSKEYGPVFRVKVGQGTTYFLCSYEAVKEALVDQPDIFAGRMKSEFFDSVKRDFGIVGSDGAPWKVKRRNALHILRDFGFGKEGSKEVIQSEIEEMFKIIDKKNGEGLDTKNMYNYATSNIICGISMNERPSYTDQKYQKVVYCFDKLLGGSMLDMLLLLFPILGKLPLIPQYLEKKTHRLEYFQTCFDYIMEKVKEHRKTFLPDQEPRDFIDAMLLLENEAKKEIDYTKENYDFQIMRIVFELFIAGTDTTATTLGWVTALMAVYPEIQSKVQSEIDEVVGRDGVIKMEHKKDLHYTCAVIDEVQRFASIATFSIGHRTMEHGTALGYDIPKNSSVLPHLTAVHRDPSHWEKPNSFYPGHFLTTDGKLYKPNDHLIPFSLGRRACMGESLANMELFLISTSLIREYHMKLDHPYSEEEIKKLLVGTTGNVHRINQHQIIFTRRK